VHRDKYDPPGVGSIVPLRSQYARDISSILVKQLNQLLESEGYLEDFEILPLREDKLKINLKDFLDIYPSRIHDKHWIDSGKQISVIHPETYLPFFFNVTGSNIIRLLNGRHKIQDILDNLKNNWTNIEDMELEKDFIKFILLLEELDLIKF
jgi:ribosomal protein S8